MARLLVVDREFIEAGQRRTRAVVEAYAKAPEGEDRILARTAVEAKLDGVFRLLGLLADDLGRRQATPVVLELPLADPVLTAEASISDPGASTLVLDDVEPTLLGALKSRAIGLGLTAETLAHALLARAIAQQAQYAPDLIPTAPRPVSDDEEADLYADVAS
jgi:hypothetical protein